MLPLRLREFSKTMENLRTRSVIPNLAPWAANSLSLACIRIAIDTYTFAASGQLSSRRILICKRLLSRKKQLFAPWRGTTNTRERLNRRKRQPTSEQEVGFRNIIKNSCVTAHKVVDQLIALSVQMHNSKTGPAIFFKLSPWQLTALKEE